jgi:putative transposase
MTAPADLRSDRLCLRIRGCTRWNGKPGRAELLWDPARNVWYLHQSVKVSAPAGRPRERRWAAVDRGARGPLALAIEGVPEVLLFRARELWKDFLYWSRQIARLQSRLRTRARRACA